MRGVAFDKIGASPMILDGIETPEPADDQILVKSIYTAINPVDGFMASTGILIVQWPFVMGCDAAGIVVEAGAGAIGSLGPFQVGDQVLGCTRLGSKGHSTCQEYFLMDARVTTPKPKNITLAQAATVGVGFYTACLGVLDGLVIALPDPTKLPAPTGEWAVVLGGASSVGKFAVQLLKALGFSVATTCSAKSAESLKSIGADATINYKETKDEQVARILSETEGKPSRVFDAVAMNEDLVKALFAKVEGRKYFSTTNDWTPMAASDFSGVEPYKVMLGPIGRFEAMKLDTQLASYIPLIVSLIESEKVIPAEYEIIGKTGLDSVLEAYAYQGAGKGGIKKVLVKLQDE